MAIPALRQLNDIITSALNDIDSRFVQSSVTFPSLDDVYNPEAPAEAILAEPAMLRATSLVIAAASQLIASVRHPAQTLIGESTSIHATSCMRAVIMADVVEIVRDAGIKGIHCKDIAKINGTDPQKTARILRLLSNRHIFREVSPDVFALNRISSLMDTGKEVSTLRKQPEEKHAGATSGLPAMLAYVGYDVMRSSAFLAEAYTDPRTALSSSPTHTPWNLAFSTSETLFEWYERPENEARRKLFGVAMRGTKLSSDDGTLSGFDWASLPKGSTIVDVGGGLGTASMSIAKHVPHVKIVVQDRASVIAEGKKHWKETLPEAVDSGRVKFQAHDFFEVEPITAASAFLLRFIIHDWPDVIAKIILKRLRAAATPTTKLIVMDSIIPYTCASDEGGIIPDIPSCLLPTLGPVSDGKYVTDMAMYVLFNSQERTASHFSVIAAECGWKVEAIYRLQGSLLDQYVAVPVSNKLAKL